jgi:hypothetical protein
MSKVISVRIRDVETWLRFKGFVAQKHGKLHTALGYELTEALKQYLKNAERAHTYTYTPASESTSACASGCAPKGKSAEAGSRTLRNLREITNRILEVTEKEIPQTIVERIITEAVGGEVRTIRRYVTSLANYGILKPVRRMPAFGMKVPKFIFEVDLDEAKKLIGIRL